jgi:hypothetical protein
VPVAVVNTRRCATPVKYSVDKSAKALASARKSASSMSNDEFRARDAAVLVSAKSTPKLVCAKLPHRSRQIEDGLLAVSNRRTYSLQVIKP